MVLVWEVLTMKMSGPIFHMQMFPTHAWRERESLKFHMEIQDVERAKKEKKTFPPPWIDENKSSKPLHKKLLWPLIPFQRQKWNLFCLGADLKKLGDNNRANPKYKRNKKLSNNNTHYTQIIRFVGAPCNKSKTLFYHHHTFHPSKSPWKQCYVSNLSYWKGDKRHKIYINMA